MNVYSIARMAHMAGALVFFIALGLEWASLWYTRRSATAEQVRRRMRVFNGARRVGLAAMLLILLSGLYMMGAVWGAAAWIVVTLGTLALLFIPGAVYTGARMAAAGRALATEQGPVSGRLHDLLHQPLLWTSVQARVALAVGILILMGTKPDLTGSLMTISGAAALGLASTLPLPHRRRVQEGPAD